MNRASLIVIAVVGISVALTGCNLFVENTRTYKQWAQKYEQIEAGTYQSPVISSSEDTNALRDDFVSVMEAYEENLFSVALKRVAAASEKPLAWRAGSILYLRDFGPYFGKPAGYTCGVWKAGVQQYWNPTASGTSYTEDQKLLFAFVATHFDEIDFSDGLDAPQRLSLLEMRPERMK